MLLWKAITNHTEAVDLLPTDMELRLQIAPNKLACAHARKVRKGDRSQRKNLVVSDAAKGELGFFRKRKCKFEKCLHLFARKSEIMYASTVNYLRTGPQPGIQPGNCPSEIFRNILRALNHFLCEVKQKVAIIFLSTSPENIRWLHMHPL